MDLKSLIVRANTTYGLGLDASRVDELQRRLRLAGLGIEIQASQTGEALDTILSLSDHLEPDSSPRSVYASLKQEAVADLDGACPRCRGAMKSVKLVGSREAQYCQACNITLPIKVE
jgi:formamidopyrimidine-DNA glycosylase